MGDMGGEPSGGLPVQMEKMEPCASRTYTGCVAAAILTSLLGCGVLLSMSAVPLGVVLMWVPTMMGLVGMLGMYACFSKGCKLSWKGWWTSCGVSHREDEPFQAVKMLCCALSSTGPVFIMCGSVAMLWCLKLHSAAVALGASSMGLVVVVLVMDILAVVRCAACLGQMCRGDKEGRIVSDLKLCASSAANAEIWQLFLGIGICMGANAGITVAIWVLLGSMDSLWESGLGYVPVGLAIFLVPVITTCLVLNCLMIVSCVGSLWRCIKHSWQPNREDDWKSTIYSPDSDGESWTIELGVIQTVPPDRMSIV